MWALALPWAACAAVRLLQWGSCIRVDTVRVGWHDHFCLCPQRLMIDNPEAAANLAKMVAKQARR